MSLFNIYMQYKSHDPTVDRSCAHTIGKVGPMLLVFVQGHFHVIGNFIYFFAG